MSKFSKTEPDAWKEWKALCAIERCGGQVQDNLCTYGGQVFSQLWHKYSGGLALPFESNVERWHLFESYMHNRSSRTEKRWKDWLFEKAVNSSDDFVTVLEKEAYVCMKTTVIKLCSNEGHLKARLSGVWLTAMDAPLSSTTDSHATFGDNHAGNPWEDPAQTAAWNELREIARIEAADLFNTLDQKGKTALLADCLGISLAAPEVKALASKGKSVLYDSLIKLQKKAESRLQDAYSAEDARTLQLLIAFTREALHEAIFIWGKSEKLADPLFTLSENRMNP